MKFIFFVFILFYTLKGFAGNVFDLNYSIRAASMGGAYTAVVDNADALFYNPASLARIDGVAWTILDANFGASNPSGAQALMQFIQGGSPSDLANFYGQPIWLGGHAKTSVSTPYFGFAYFDQANLRVELTNPSFPTMDIDYINDLGVSLGFAFPVIPKALYAGFALKSITRTGGSQSFSGATIASLDSSAIVSSMSEGGRGLGFDFALNITPPVPGIDPVISLVWLDVGQTFYGTPLQSIPKQQDNMIVGFSMDVDAGPFAFVPSLEIQYINDPTIQFGNKLHLGAEFSMPLFDIRGGFNQGYYSLGAAMNMGVFNLELATYGVELGAAPGQIEDRRYVLNLTFEIGVGLGFTGIFEEGTQNSSGARRRLKQRR